MRRHVKYVWIDTNSKIYIDDNVVTENLITAKMAPKVYDDPELVTILNVDESVNYGVVDVVLDKLKEAKAYRITFATEFWR